MKLKRHTILLRLSLLVLFLWLLSYAVIPFGISMLAQVFPSTVVELTNRDRAMLALPRLDIDPLLMRAAQMKAEDMRDQGYFSHRSPKGITPWYWFDAVGYPYSYAGENLALNYYDSEEVLDAWMESQSHYSNIVSKNFAQVGVGVATGTYDGRPAVFIAQFFGKRAW